MQTDSRTPLIQAAQDLRHAVQSLRFGSGVHVYNPLDYAWDFHRAYLDTYGSSPKRVLFLGMNPGPFGMMQTGVPFGEVAAVRDWMKLEGRVRAPAQQHPKRPILGFGCPRSEVSGRRLWGLFAERFGKAQTFFQDHFVLNYCPLAFLAPSGGNITPDKLPVRERQPLLDHCDRHLLQVLGLLRPQWAIGIGDFARQCLVRVASGYTSEAKVTGILHPSPASPAANRDWAGQVTRKLEQLGVW